MQHLVIVQVAVVAVVTAALAPEAKREAIHGHAVVGFALGCCDINHAFNFMGTTANGLAAAVGGGGLNSQLAGQLVGLRVTVIPD